VWLEKWANNISKLRVRDRGSYFHYPSLWQTRGSSFADGQQATVSCLRSWDVNAASTVLCVVESFREGKTPTRFIVAMR
jgi:hypothetical protein